MSSQRNSAAQPPALPSALQAVSTAWKQVEASVKQAGRLSQQEASSGATAPTREAMEAWTVVAENVAPLLRGALHLADGGSYSHDNANTEEVDQSSETGQSSAGDESATKDSPSDEFDRERHDFAKACRAIRDATDAEIDAALELFHDTHRVKTQPITFVRYPGYTGVCAHEQIVSAHGAKRKTDPVTRDSDVEWHRQVWGLTESPYLVRSASFVNPDVVGTDAAPREGQYITEIDVRAQYLAAARMAELGTGDPCALERLDDLDDWLKKPGYVQLASAPDMSGSPGHIRGAFANLGPGSLLPSPLAKYLRGHSIELDVDWALMWPQKAKARPLERVAALFAQSRADLAAAAARGESGADLAYQLDKQIYSSFLGGMVRSEEHNDRSSLRPDWWDQYVALASANLLRHHDKAAAHGWHPLASLKDSSWYVADYAPAKPAGLDFTDGQPGKFKEPERWGVVDTQLLRACEHGQPVLVRNAVIAADVRRREQEEGS